MASSSRYSRHVRRDRLNVNVVLKQSRDTEPQSPYLHWLFVENSEDDINSRLTDATAEGADDGDGYGTAEAVIMKEVAAWLEMCDNDDFWVAKGPHARKAVLPTTSQLLARWKDTDLPLPCNLEGTSAFDAFVKSIALQLLASCYTVLPTTSASHLPLFQQRTSESIVTALHAHALHRLAPAAGHQARAPSETSPWSALYTGPEPEDVLAETLSRRRRSMKQSSEYVPSFAASGWTDGANEAPPRKPPQPLRVEVDRSSSSSSSSDEPDLFARLRCQPSIRKIPRGRNSAACSRILSCSRGRSSGDSPSQHSHQKQPQDLGSPAAQRIPSTMRNRRTQSVPRMKQFSDPRDPTSDPMPKPTQHPDSGSSIEDRVRYKYDIPAIRRLSPAPHASQKTKSFLSARNAGNSDMMSSSGTPDEGKPAMSGVSNLQPGSSQGVGPSPLRAPQAEASDDYFGLENSALHDSGHGGMDADELNPRSSSPNYHKIVGNICNDDSLSFDANGQTAQDVSDAQLRRMITKRRKSSDDSDSPDGIRRRGSLDLVVRARRRKSIGYPAGQTDEELVRRFSLTWEGKMRERQGAGNLEGEEGRP